MGEINRGEGLLERGRVILGGFVINIGAFSCDNFTS